MKIHHSMILLLAFVLTASCSDSHDTVSFPETDSLAAGIYTAKAGSMFVPESSGSVDEGNVNVIIAGTGESVFYLHDGPLHDGVIADDFPFQIAGPIGAPGKSLSTSLTVYPDGTVDANPLVAEGTVLPKESISADYTWGEESGSFQLIYSSLYDESSSLEKLEGIWTISWGISLDDGTSFEYRTMTLTVFSDGTISGSDTLGCVFSGLFSIIDADHGVYRVSLELSSCGDRDGSYDGLAYVTPATLEGVDGRVLRMGTFNQQRSFNARLFGPLFP